MKLLLLSVALAVTTLPLLAQIPPPAASPSPSPAKPPADYDLRWAVKIPMRDTVELNATFYLPKTSDGSPPKTPAIFTLTPYISDTYHARAPLTSRRTGTCLHLSMFAAAAIPEASSNRSRRSRATVTMQSSGSRASHSATVKSPCGADRTQD